MLANSLPTTARETRRLRATRRFIPMSKAQGASRRSPLNALQHYDEALLCLERALALDSNLAASWAAKAVALRALGRAAEVKAAARRASELGG